MGSSLDLLVERATTISIARYISPILIKDLTAISVDRNIMVAVYLTYLTLLPTLPYLKLTAHIDGD